MITFEQKKHQYVCEDGIGEVISADVLEAYRKHREAEENIPHKVSEVICVKCLRRWISVRPHTTLLKHLECPTCGQIESVIETGQDLEV